MKLTGLGLSQALYLGAIFAGILLVLYILKLRRRRIEVPFSPLWSRVLVDKQTTSWLQRLKRLLSLLLWLAITAMLLLALTDPRPEQEIERGRSVVILLDTSASMSAAEYEDPSTGRMVTRWDLAKEKAYAILDDLGPNDRATLIAMDGQVRSVTGDFTDNPKTLRDALDDLEPTATEARVLDGLRTAVDTLSSRKEPQIHLISDGAWGENFVLPEKLIGKEISFEHHLVGEASGNIAISGFNIRRYLSNKLDYEVYVQVRNYFDRPVFAELNLYNLIPRTDGGFHYKIIEKRTLELGPGASELRFYENLALASEHLAARVELKSPGLTDALALDNEAFVLVPRFEQARVLVVTEFIGGRPTNLFLQAALLLNENFDVTFMAPDDPFLHPGGSEEINLANLRTARPAYNVVIFDNSMWEEGKNAIAPAADVEGNFLYINPRGDLSPFATSNVKEPLVERVDRKHPVARWLVMKNLNIARGTKIRTRPRDEVIVRSIDGPLVVARREPGRNLLAVGFSLVESDIVFRVALPVLLINAVDWFTDESNSLIQAYRTGDNWHVPVPIGASAINVRAPDGKVDLGLPTHEGKAVYYGPHTGFYRLAHADDVTFAEGWEIAANFSSPRESNITPATEPLPSQTAATVTLAERTEDLDPRLQEWAWLLEYFTYEIWLYCVFAVLGLLVIEWFTYHRRWTV